MKLYDETDCLPHVKPAPLSGWQPIETAPKDGTEVDLWACSGGDPKYGDRYTNAAFIRGKWRYSHGDDGWLEVSYKPTHWMPLPASPVADAVLREAGE